MIRINLLPRENQSRWRLGRANGAGLSVVLLFAATLAAMAGWFWSLRAASLRLAAEIAAAEAEAARHAPLLDVVRQLESRQAQLQQRLGVAAKLRGGGVSVGPLLRAIANVAPEGLWLLELTCRERQLTIRGVAASLADVSTLVSGLETSRLFGHPVEVVDTERAPLDRERGAVTFTVKATSN